MPILENSRHEIFAQELAKGATQTEAYLTAGYKGDRTAASRLSTNINIQERVAELKSAIAERVEVDEAYVLGTIKETVERCKQSAPVRDRKGEIVLTETPDGSLTPAYEFNAGAVLKGAELLGKYLGMFVEKHEHTGKDGGPIETADLSDMETIKRMRFLMSRAKAQPSIN